MHFRGKRHARAEYKRLRFLDNRPADARRFVRDAVEAEREYERIIRGTTKQTIKRDKAAERAEKEERRRGTTRTLGKALEETGLQVFFADTIEAAVRDRRPYRAPVSLRFPGDEPGTEIVHPVTNIRRVNFFPEIAGAKHARLERELAAFVLERISKGKLVSMMTFNGGARWRDGAETGRLREGRGEMRAAMTRLFRSRTFQRFFAPLFTGEEYGTPKGRYSARRRAWRWHMHTHAHILVEARERAPDFNRLMTWVRLRYHGILAGRKYPGLIKLLDFGKPVPAELAGAVKQWMEDSQALALVEYDGAIRDVQEACKYPMKDKDLVALCTEGGAQPIRDLYDNLFHARLCTPRGSFRKWRKRLYEPDGFRRKLIAEKTPEGDSVYRSVKDWNCQTANMAEAICGRKERAEKRKSLNRLKEQETRELREILKSRMAEWERFQKNRPGDFREIAPPDSGNRPGAAVPEGDFRGDFKRIAPPIPGNRPPRFGKSPPDYIESFPRNDFRIERFDYHLFPAWFCLKREICALYGRLMGSAVLFDLGIPGFVLEHLRGMRWHIAEENAAVHEIRYGEGRVRKPVRNLVVARIAPSFIGGGAIARPGIVVIGATGDMRVWRNNDLARRLERIARPCIAEAVTQREWEEAAPDFAPPADGADDAAAPAGAGDFIGSSQTPLNFPFYNLGPPGNGPGNAQNAESTALAEA
ncbi:MAG: hypothetical protein LBC18_10760 [Opitutaceae bacterium]|jgi:hypothetical protein|nr:hypothetical protein [Opitutaceae bacterium]